MIGSDFKIAVNGVSDVGLSRDHNEDCIAWHTEMGLVILADGMGGHNAGEVASQMAVESISDALQEVLTPEMLGANIIKCEDAVREAIVYANEEIHEQAHLRLDCAGMGTTIVITLFHEDQVTYANVGDSRIYRLRNNELQQITSDHSLVQEMVDNGYLSQEEALISTSRNLITRALGIAPEVEVDIRTEAFDKDDVYLLCSDGLTDLVNDNDILSILVNNRSDMAVAAEELVELANTNGGSDNISVILVALHEAFSDERGLPGIESGEITITSGESDVATEQTELADDKTKGE